MDIDLGRGIDGTEAAQAILRERDIPIVFLSSHIEKETVEKTEKITSYGYVVKNSGITVMDASIKMAFRLYEEKERVRKKHEELEAANEELTATNEELERSEEAILGRDRNLRESEEKFRKLYEEAQFGIILSDNLSNILEANPMALSILGYSRDEINGMNARDLIHPDDIKAVHLAPNRNEARQKGVTRVERRYKKRSGEYIPVDVTVSFISDPGFHHVIFQDISERRKAEKEIKRSEERFRAIVTNGPAVFILTDEQGTVSYISPQCQKSLGHPCEKFLGKKFPDIIHPDDMVKCRDAWEGLMHHGKELTDFEYRIIDSDGNARWLSHSARLLPLDGKITGMQSMILNITPRKLAVEARRETEEKYRHLYKTMGQGVVYQAADGTIISANPAAETILGLTQEQMMERTSMNPEWKSLREDGSELPGEEHPSMAALRTGRPVNRFIMGVMNPEKSRHNWISVTAVPLFRPGEEKPYQVYTTFDDITELKRARDDAIENHQRLLSVMEASPDPVYVVDPETSELLYANSALIKATGARTGKKCHEELQQRKSPCPFCTNEKILGDNFGKTHIWEFRNEKNGRLYRCADRAITWPDGRIVRYETATDITDLKNQ